jgi:hypothetical protein
MKSLVAATAWACALAALLAGAGPARAAEYGVTEDFGKASPEWILETLQDLGMTRNVVSLTFDPAEPAQLPQASEIDRLAELAPRYGVKLAFAVYQRRAGSLASPAGLAAFSSWLGTAARRWPSVTTWIAPNEPNQPRFWQPQFTPGCANASGAAYFRAQATMYDALKSVDARNEVVGVALSPRGNDLCRAASNVSTSPVRFLEALGAAMRASRRNRPIMDAISQHPYPLLNTHAPTVGYRWPNVGLANMDRLKQAVWDAFGGTRQPTFEQGLKVYLDELGWQTASPGEAYAGLENVAVVDEATQGRYYAQSVRMASCDPSVAALSFFHLVDEADRDRFQSGLLRADGTAKASVAPVRSAIATARSRGCGGRPVAWRHATAPLGLRVRFGGAGAARTVVVSAAEDVTFRAAILPAATREEIARTLLGTVPAGISTGVVRAYRAPVLRVPRATRRGRAVVAVRVAASTNPSRATVVVGPAFVLR